MSQKTKQVNKNKNTKYFSERFGINFRSTWENELANVLADLDITFEYEPRRFFFRDHQESYLPDFYLPQYNCWVECKGYMDKRSEKRCKLFKKYHKKEFGYFLWMKEERALTLKNPEIIYTFLEIAEEERLRNEKQL